MNTKKLEDYLYIKLEHGELSESPLFYPYVYETLLQAAYAEKAMNPEQTQNFSPAKCLGLLTDRLKAEYGPFAQWVLANWKVHDSKQVGKVIFDLAEAGCLTLSGDEKQEDFEKAGLWV